MRTCFRAKRGRGTVCQPSSRHVLCSLRPTARPLGHSDDATLRQLYSCHTSVVDKPYGSPIGGQLPFRFAEEESLIIVTAVTSCFWALQRHSARLFVVFLPSHTVLDSTGYARLCERESLKTKGLWRL